MKKFLVQFVFLIIIIAGSLYFFSPKSGPKNLNLPFLPQKTTLATLDINGHIFKVEIAENSEVISTAKVGDTGVAFLFTQKIKAAQGTEQQEMEHFYVKIPLELKHYYEVASLVAQAEQNYSFL
mgnify:CR=1 FL=1